jgi:CDP-diacylglycerol--glycerol-3-phosphate 3-phosphatidyltransferase
MPFVERRWRPRRPLTRDQLLGIANYLTYGRIAIVPVVVLFLMGINDFDPERVGWNKFFSWMAMLFFVLAQISDVIDGHYARKYGVVSSFGKFVDPLADKLMSMSVLIMLIPLGRIAAWMVVLLIARDVTITALRSIAASEGIEISASDWGKKKTLIQAFSLGFLLVHYPFWGLDPRPVGLVLLWATLIVSIGSGVHYVLTFFNEVLEKQKVGKRT